MLTPAVLVAGVGDVVTGRLAFCKPGGNINRVKLVKIVCGHTGYFLHCKGMVLTPFIMVTGELVAWSLGLLF